VSSEGELQRREGRQRNIRRTSVMKALPVEDEEEEENPSGSASVGAALSAGRAR